MSAGVVRLGLLERAATTPGEAAIRSDGLGEATWAETADAVRRLAAALTDFDLGSTRRLLVIARNRPATVVAHAAALLGEASSVPVNFHLTAGEIEYIADESGSRLAFVDSTSVDATRRAVEGRGVTIVQIPDGGLVGDDLAAFVGGHAPIELRAEQRVIPNLLFTSGTTGRPKAVQLPPKTIGDSPDLAGFAEHIAGHRLAKLGTHLVVGPLYHNGPLTAVRLLLAGVPLVVHQRFDAEATLAAIADHGIESSIMVPTHFVRALALPQETRDRYDVSSLRSVSHTGGTCPIDVKRAMIEWWGPVLSESYGGTESGTVCSINSADWLTHPGSVGRANPPFEALVVDEDGNELPANTEGRLYFRDTTGRGIVYDGDPQKTAEAHLAPGVFTLGEIGTIDSEGFVYITDRFSDMVVSGGVNIYPAEAEQALAKHDDVVDVACIGVPDAEMGEQLIALVQLRHGAHADADALTSWCRELLAGYKCPKHIRFVDEVPRNPMGKIDKKTLRGAYTSSTEGERP
ncbi:MAG TPA: AMP-binding protein [Ilumatobacteraceae bacterium]